MGDVARFPGNRKPAVRHGSFAMIIVLPVRIERADDGGRARAPQRRIIGQKQRIEETKEPSS